MNSMNEMPIMRQYKALKREAPAGSVLLLSMGDFYEAFGEDAIILAQRFGTPLSMRGGVPMTGCHRFSLDTRMHSRFAGGVVFAIAEVMEGRRSHGGLLRREIVRIVNGGESDGAAQFALENATPAELTAEQERQKQREEIARRIAKPLKGNGAVNVQPQFDLGQTGQMDLFAPIMEEAAK